MPFELHAIVGDLLVRSGPSYTFGQLAQAIAAPDLPVRAYTMADRLPAKLRGVRVIEAVAPFYALRRAPLRFLRPWGARRNVRQLLAALRRTSANRCVWTFGNVPLDLMQALHAEGVPVIREKYNCAQRIARDLVVEEYRRLSLEPQITITDESIRHEEEAMALTSAVFCPSPQVAASLRTIGLPADKLIETSYGWEPARFPDADRVAAKPPGTGPTVLFLGYACVRKGAHVLLEAWRRSGSAGQLLIVGNIEPVIAERYAEHLALPSVRHIPFTHNVGALLRSADWMAFPTIEEGSALVTYEALGNGVPLITTPMGAGALVRDGIEGLVLSEATVDDWTAVLASLADRGAEQQRLADQARTRARDFTWSLVGERRRAQIVERFAD